MINKEYENTIGGSRRDFANFVQDRHPELHDVNPADPDDAKTLDDHIDFLAHRVGQNLFIYENNLSTAKSDYLQLVACLLKKGIVFNDERASMRPSCADKNIFSRGNVITTNGRNCFEVLDANTTEVVCRDMLTDDYAIFSKTEHRFEIADIAKILNVTMNDILDETEMDENDKKHVLAQMGTRINKWLSKNTLN